MPSTQVEEFEQGKERHSSTFVSHSTPVHPTWQSHVQPSTMAMHAPACRHGDDEHSFTFSWHDAPVHPGAHVQAKASFSMSMRQVPPLRQGEVPEHMSAVEH
jgi:hypothetical protein